MADREPVDRDKRTTLRQFAAIGAVSPFVAFLDSDANTGTPDTRQAILGYLSTTPGAHFSKIRDDLSLGTGETQHHLRQLLDGGAVENFSDGEYRRFVLANQFTPFERTALGYLRRNTPRRILLALLRDPTVTNARLARRVGVSPATVSRTISDLDAGGLIDRGDRIAIQEPETIITLIVRFADSFDEQTVDFAKDAATVIRYDPNSDLTS